MPKEFFTGRYSHPNRNGDGPADRDIVALLACPTRRRKRDRDTSRTLSTPATDGRRTPPRGPTAASVGDAQPGATFIDGALAGVVIAALLQ